MKKWIFILIIFSGFAFGVTGGPFWRGTTLTAKKVLKKWGNVPFNAEIFRLEDVTKRAPMAYPIMTNKKYVGISIEEVRSTFGQPDGSYFIDSYPAYIIQEGKNHKEETWQIVFLLNGKYKVRDIIVHKNCCD